MYYEAIIQENNNTDDCVLKFGPLNKKYSELEILVTEVLTRSVEDFKKENLKFYFDSMLRKR